LKLFEFEAKNEFSKHNIPVPNGTLATTAEQAMQAAAKLNMPCIIKAQVLTGGRAKAGGILTANSIQAAEDAASKLLGEKIKNLPVQQLLIEEKLQTRRELYLAITIDRLNRSYLALSSSTGGVDIEETVDQTPNLIQKTPIHPNLGLCSFHANMIAKQLGYSGNQLLTLSSIILKLYQTCLDNDAELAEINPLAETAEGEFIALDARLIIDDNALFRHPEYAKRETQQLTAQEASALQSNLAYVKLSGDIGIAGNGAGLVMATLDLLNYFGGKPANFLDLGGGATIEQITAAAKIVLSDPDTKVVLINILGGITHCDNVAKGILQAVNETGSKKPLIVRLLGTNQQDGQKILTDADMQVYDSMEEAAKQAVALTKKGAS
jgi:succinyl-CoA synthetase beta subunit